MKTRILQTKIWGDPYYSDLTTQEKLLFLYLLTNDKVNIIHCYEITRRQLSFDTGIQQAIVDKICLKFNNDGRFGLYKDWVYIVNAYKYEEYKGESNEVAKVKLIKEMSKDVLDWYEAVLDRGVERGVYTTQAPPISNKSEVISKNGVVKGDTENYILEFNRLFNSSYLPTDGRREKMKARLKTFTYENVITATRNLSSSAFHRGENDRKWKADPDFLLRADEQIDKWLNYKLKKRTLLSDLV